MKRGMNNIVLVGIGAIAGAIAGVAGVKRTMRKALQEKSDMSDKHLILFRMMNQWVNVKQQGINLSSYFEKAGYKNIAIYGMSYAGETLLAELRETATQVVYGIDQRADRLFLEVDVVKPNDRLEKVDAIVVTAISFFDDIKEDLGKKVDCPIISLEEVLADV